VDDFLTVRVGSQRERAFFLGGRIGQRNVGLTYGKMWRFGANVYSVPTAE